MRHCNDLIQVQFCHELYCYCILMPRKGSDVQGIYVDDLAMQHGQYVESDLLFSFTQNEWFRSNSSIICLPGIRQTFMNDMDIIAYFASRVSRSILHKATTLLRSCISSHYLMIVLFYCRQLFIFWR